MLIAKRAVAPPTTPPSEKTITNVVGGKILTNVGVVGTGIEKGGVGEKGRGRVIPVEAILKCPHCGREAKTCFAYGKPPEWVRCPWCRELQPADGYRVIAYGRGLPQPLAPHEVKERMEVSHG